VQAVLLLPHFASLHAGYKLEIEGDGAPTRLLVNERIKRLGRIATRGAARRVSTADDRQRQ